MLQKDELCELELCEWNLQEAAHRVGKGVKEDTDGGKESESETKKGSDGGGGSVAVMPFCRFFYLWIYCGFGS